MLYSFQFNILRKKNRTAQRTSMNYDEYRMKHICKYMYISQFSSLAHDVRTECEKMMSFSIQIF